MGDRSAKWREPDWHQFIVECSQKSTKFLSQNKQYYITDIPDELLVEILCRLPRSTFAIQCKCVCKRWAALISQPSFISCFIAHKVESCAPCIENHVMPVEVEERSFAIVARSRVNRYSKDSWNGVVMCLRNPVQNVRNFSVSPLPQLRDESAIPLTVIAACNDLLLYYGNHDNNDYYICNVQTKQWLHLPSPKFHFYHFYPVGLICDPYYSCETGRHGCNVTLNSSYQYSIVVVPSKNESVLEYIVHLFTSTTNKWTEIVLSMPIPCKVLCNTICFRFAGMLHLLTRAGLIAFDPYSCVNNVKPHIIGAWPGPFPYVFAAIGVRNGHLQLCNRGHDKQLYFWVLKDYKMGEWKLEHRIEWRELIIPDSRLVELHKKNGSLGIVLGLHPIDPDIVYLLDSSWVMLCNARTRTAEIVSTVDSIKLYRTFSRYCMMIPVWPTPISSPYLHHV